MYKSAVRNMQRVTLNTVMGRKGAAKGPPAMTAAESAKLADRIRLARARRIFELEKEIEAVSARGESVARLRAELDGVRKGTVKVSLSLARDPAPRKGHAPETARRKGPERPSAGRSRPRPKEAIERELTVDLDDLAKGKVTLSGVAVVKTLLLSFSRDDITEILKADPKVVGKIADSPLIGLAPLMEGEVGLVLVDILEERLRKAYPEDAREEAPEGGPSGPRVG